MSEQVRFSSVTLGVGAEFGDVWRCEHCGALVGGGPLDRVTHSAWHSAVSDRLDQLAARVGL